MNINVTMASGEFDEWEDVTDAVEDRGSLVVVDEIEEDEVPGWMKTLDVTTEGKTETLQVLAVYAPGMWMKVEFNQ